MSEPDRLARRGILMTGLGLLALPGVLALVATVPQGARKAAFFLGLLAAAAVSSVGGLSARTALSGGTTLSGRAWFGAIVGLSVGATVGLFLVWSLLGATL